MSKVAAFIRGLIRYVRPNGAPVPGHVCIVPSNQVQTYVVRIRSLNGVAPGELKRAIQQRYEVIGNPEVTDTLVVTR